MSRRSSQLLAWLLVLPLLAAAVSGLFGCRASPAEVARGPAELVFAFDRLANGVRVSASARCPAGATEWSLPANWGGNDAPDRDLGALAAEDGTGAPLVVERKAANAWVVHAPREGLQTVRYELAPNAHLASEVHTDHYRPIVTPELFHVLGGRAILVPSSLPRDRDVRTRFHWRGFDAPGWRIATSFGCGRAELDVDARLDDLQHAVYVGGELALERREVRGRPVYVAVHGLRWATPIADFADLAARIVEHERAFFDDWDYPHYLISLVEAGPDGGGSRSIGGTGLHDSFAMFLSPGTSLHPAGVGEKQVLHVLAHEMFHHWDGGVISPEAPEELSYWFTEGFTDYFTRRLLFRAGLYAEGDFAANLNEKLAGYYASSVREAPAERIREAFWSDPAISSLPYQRGDAIAIELDYAIRRASGGARTIDDWMRDLFARAREVERPLTRDELFASIAEFSDASTAESLRAVALDGKLLAPRADWFAPCLTHELVESGTFELGFDFEATQRAQAITGLRPGSAAERAGLREGDVLGGWSVALGDANRAVQITVREGAATRQIEFLPRASACTVPAFRFVPGAACGPASGL